MCCGGGRREGEGTQRHPSPPSNLTLLTGSPPHLTSLTSSHILLSHTSRPFRRTSSRLSPTVESGLTSLYTESHHIRSSQIFMYRTSSLTSYLISSRQRISLLSTP